MRILKRLIVFVIVFLVVLFVCVSVYIHFYGKDIMVGALTNSLGRQVAIENISYRFPLGLKAQDIVIAKSLEGGEFFKAKDITARLSPDAIIQRQLIFDSVMLVKPFVVIEKVDAPSNAANALERRHGVVVPPDATSTPSAEDDSGLTGIQTTKQSEVYIDRLILRQGHVEYSNTSINKDFSVALEDVYLKYKHLSFPLAAGRSDFNVSGRLIKKGNPLSGSSVEGSGWVDIVNRDMEAKMEVVEADGSVGMSAQAASKNNDMTVVGDIKFENILMGTKKENTSEASPVNDLISNALSSAGVQIGAQFSFNTKMDNFRPEKVSFTGNVVTK